MKSKRKSLVVLLGIVVALIIAATILLIQVLGLKKDLQSQKEAMNAAKEVKVEKEEFQIKLPEVYYAATGLTTEIYNSQITNIGGDITAYNVLWTCDVGENLERKYSLTATEDMIGAHELTVSIYDNALNLLAEKTCTLKVVEGKLQDEVSFVQIGERVAGDEAFYNRLQELSEGRIRYEMVETGKLADYEDIYLIAASISVDREYNYDSDLLSLNQAGYYQLADVIFSILCGTENN